MTMVIYHGNCADGFTAAWCFWREFEDNWVYIPGVYQEPPPRNLEGHDIYLVDFSYKRSVVAQMIKEASSVTLIDHHKSAIEDLEGLANLKTFTDLNRSGARLAWDYLNPGIEPPQLLKHVEDRDLWRFALPGTREIQACLFSYDYDFEVWDRLMAMDVRNLFSDGTAIERKHHKDIRELLLVCQRRMVINGHDVPVASLPYTLSSDAGHVMAEGEPFAACYWDTEDGRIFSLRSDENGLDVSLIAGVFGGGGHLHAAGFKVPRNHELAGA